MLWVVIKFKFIGIWKISLEEDFKTNAAVCVMTALAWIGFNCLFVTAVVAEIFSKEFTALQKKIIDRNFDTYSKDDKIEDDITGFKI